MVKIRFKKYPRRKFRIKWPTIRIRKHHRAMAAMCAIFLLALCFGTPTYAGGGPEGPEGQAEPEATGAEREGYPDIPAAEIPFTPSGTATVIDNATDKDGKEFYTIMTPAENVFYLVIDRQREGDNVYFLNAVTEQDLLALAGQPEKGEEEASAIPEETPDPTIAAAPMPEPEPEKGGGPGATVLIVTILAVGGAAGYYFKVYLPKQRQPESGETVEEYEDGPEDGYLDGEQGEDDYGDDGFSYVPLTDDEEEDGR